jgi:hypothetical protein
MMNIHDIIKEINIDNSSNNKLATLKKHSDNEFLQKILKMAYDSVAFTYGVSIKQTLNFKPNIGRQIDLDFAVDALEYALSTRDVTGHEACQLVADLIANLNDEDANLIKQIINRDLRINVGKTQINKIWKGLITKPPYSRCSIGSKANIEKNIDFTKKVFSTLKLDGTYRSCLVLDDNVQFTSRSGQEQEFPKHEETMSQFPSDYVYIGEMTLKGEKQRSIGNGNINSSEPDHDNIIFTVWDMIHVSEYSKKNGTSNYEDRFEMLQNLVKTLGSDGVEIVPFKIVKSMRESFEHFQELTKAGFEGTVIKAHDMKWKDGNSLKQLKVKLEIDLDVICTGFTDGKIGTKRESTFGAMTFENAEGTIKGQCSGFTDEVLADFNSRRSELIGTVFTVRCNDITKARDNDFHALSHPRFIELRSKTDTDTLERSLELREMAMQLTD